VNLTRVLAGNGRSRSRRNFSTEDITRIRAMVGWAADDGADGRSRATVDTTGSTATSTWTSPPADRPRPRSPGRCGGVGSATLHPSVASRAGAIIEDGCVLEGNVSYARAPSCTRRGPCDAGAVASGVLPFATRGGDPTRCSRRLAAARGRRGVGDSDRMSVLTAARRNWRRGSDSAILAELREGVGWSGIVADRSGGDGELRHEDTRCPLQGHGLLPHFTELVLEDDVLWSALSSANDNRMWEGKVHRGHDRGHSAARLLHRARRRVAPGIEIGEARGCRSGAGCVSAASPGGKNRDGSARSESPGDAP